MVWKYKGVSGMVVFLSVIVFSSSLPVAFVQIIAEIMITLSNTIRAFSSAESAIL